MSHFNAGQFDEIVAVVQAANGVVGDDHNCGTRTMTIAGLGIFRKPGVQKGIVVPLCSSKVGFCLNQMYLEDGQARVSRDSVGGLIETGKHASLQAAVEAFNRDQEHNQWSMGVLERVVYL
jgi:hypothetical protein